MRKTRILIAGEPRPSPGALGVTNADEALREQRASGEARGSGKVAADKHWLASFAVLALDDAD